MTYVELLPMEKPYERPVGAFNKLIPIDTCAPMSKVFQTNTCLHIKAGNVLLSPRDDNLYCYDVIKGLTALSKAGAKGKKQIINFTFGPDLIPLFERTGGFEIRALTPVTIIKHRLSDLDKFLSQSVRLGQKLWSYRNRILLDQINHIYTIGQRSALERVVFFLLDIHRRQSENGNMSLNLIHPISRLDVGNYLGITIETTSRSFSKLRRDKFINFNNSGETEILLLDALIDLLR